MTRLLGFAFAMTKDGREVSYVFYAATLAAALKLAQSWSKAQGWSLVEGRRT